MWTDIPGFMSPEFEEFYTSLVLRLDHRSKMVEVGCAYGRSLAFLVHAFYSEGKPPPQLFAVDVWDEWMGGEQKDFQPFLLAIKNVCKTPYQAFEYLINRHAPLAAQHINIIQGSSVNCSRDLPDASLDVVFIDAYHDYQQGRADIQAWLPKVKPGGLLAGDDYDRDMYPGFVQAVDEELRGKFTTKGRIWIHEP